MPDSLFTHFSADTSHYSLPKRFTFPFCYQAHPLCKLAVVELQQHLLTQTKWQHNFGLGVDKADAVGKMFGVLLVQNQQGKLGYLAAFSGKIAEKNLLPKFVPPVFDMLAKDSFFLAEQSVIAELNTQVKQLSANSDIDFLTAELSVEKAMAVQGLTEFREKVVQGRKARKAQRAHAAQNLTAEQFSYLQIALGKESVADKNAMLALKSTWQQRIGRIESELLMLTDKIDALKLERKLTSNNLQKKLFAQYRFLNQAGEVKDLGCIFKETPRQVPPAGAGECAAPKLLQYAFLHQFKPLALAEFWWGVSPKSEIRQHKNYYPSCQGKCQPILSHMLGGMQVDENPLLNNPAEGKSLDIIYQDEHLLVVNKPADFLSVPGKNIKDSVQERIKTSFPQAVGSVIVHRLDMATSGLMVLALNKRVHKHLQQQFINRTVDKCYVALLAGTLDKSEGTIELPLRGDYDDLPRQLVCQEHGKPAYTQWHVIEEVENPHGKFTKVKLYPKTGRTHQLRVHCAHVLGLNRPILGDGLYGTTDERLHLHAKSLAFDHPITKERMNFEVEEAF